MLCHRTSPPQPQLRREVRGQGRILNSALAKLPALLQKIDFGCVISVCWPYIYASLSIYNWEAITNLNYCSWLKEIKTHSPREWPTNCRRRRTAYWVKSPLTLWILKWIRAYGLIFHHSSILLSECIFILSHRKKRWLQTLYSLAASTINKRIPMWSKVSASCHHLKMQKISFFPPLAKLYPPHMKRPGRFPSPADWPISSKIKFQSEMMFYNLVIKHLLKSYLFLLLRLNSSTWKRCNASTKWQ